MDTTDPQQHPWTTADELGARLGLTATTVRRHARNPATASWLPRPQLVAGRYLWATEDLVGIEQADRPGAGRPQGARDRQPRTRRPATPPTDAGTP